MKTSLLNHQTVTINSKTRCALGGLLLGTMLVSVPFVASAEDSFHEQVCIAGRDSRAGDDL